MTDDREQDQVYLEEEEEENAIIEGNKDRVYLDWLIKVETMLSSGCWNKSFYR